MIAITDPNCSAFPLPSSHFHSLTLTIFQLVSSFSLGFPHPCLVFTCHAWPDEDHHGQCPSFRASLLTTVGHISTVNGQIRCSFFSNRTTACHSDMVAPKCRVSLSHPTATPTQRTNALAIQQIQTAMHLAMSVFGRFQHVFTDFHTISENRNAKSQLGQQVFSVIWSPCKTLPFRNDHDLH